MSTISKWILRLAGWKIEGKAPVDLKKYVLIAAPHTSWWDFPLGLLIRSASKLNINYLGKHTLFKPPFGFIFKWTGGFPINRSASHNMVKQIVRYYQEEESFAIVIAPEGTRKKVKKLKSGFYYIAKLAKVPIVMIIFDWENKILLWIKTQ